MSGSCWRRARYVIRLTVVSGADLPELLEAVAVRTRQVLGALSACSEVELLGASSLPGWDRLTIACHLRYGARALNSMTLDTLADRPASYYPDGRLGQRERTLHPAAGETLGDVVESLSQSSSALEAAWRRLGSSDWQRQLREPDDNPDLGVLPLVRLPLLRLTEVEVHGTDLDLGLPDWSHVFVDAALPFRIRWLKIRRTNHRAFNDAFNGSWLLAATDGPSYIVSVAGENVETRPADEHEACDATIAASSRDLLAMLLGRPMLQKPRYTGDQDFGQAFTNAFPGP